MFRDNLVLNRALAKKAVVFALLLSHVPFLLLTPFIHPAYDDFCFAARTLRIGAFAAAIQTYNFTTGKYFGNAVFHSLNPVIYGSFTTYKIVAVLIILLTFGSVLFLVNCLFKSSTSLVNRMMLATFITAMFSNQMPEITEGYFFMSATSYYQLGNILLLVFFGLATKLSLTTKKSTRVGIFLLNCLLIVAVVGSTETNMVVFALLVFAVTAGTLLKKSETRWMWLVFSVLTIICSLIVILAPANAVRASLSPPGQHRFFYSLNMSVRQELSFLSIWFSNISFLLGTMFFIPFAAKLSDKLELPAYLRVNPLVPTFLLLAIVFLGLFPPYWALGIMGQHRTVNTVYFYFLVGWFIFLVCWVNYLKAKGWMRTEALPSYLYVLGVPILLVNLYFSNNTRTAIGDLGRGRAYRYDLAVKKRYTQYEECARQGTVDSCAVEVINDLPTTITNPYYEKEIACEKVYWNVRAQQFGSKLSVALQVPKRCV